MVTEISVTMAFDHHLCIKIAIKVFSFIFISFQSSTAYLPYPELNLDQLLNGVETVTCKSFTIADTPPTLHPLRT